MKNRTLLLLAPLCFLLSIRCQIDPEKKNNAENKSLSTDSIVDNGSNSEPVIKEYEPADDILQEYGLIENIEDGAYPFFTVTVDFIERQMKTDFNLNIEAISLKHENLTKLIGNYATIFYTSELENDLSDLHLEGVSLFGEYAPEDNSGSKQFTGILTDADEVTPGDLPGMISITAGDSKKMNFELFIDSETVKANGKTVTAFYTLRGVHTITDIRPSKE